MDLKSRLASDELVLPSSSTIPSTPPPATPSLLPWSDEEEQDCLHCRMAGDSYSEVCAQLIRLQHPLRSVEEIHAKLEELEKGSNHALHAHLKGFGWKGDVVGVKAHLEKRRKKEQFSSSSSRLESESKSRLRPTKRARISSPQPSSSRITRTLKRERERETSSSPPPRKIKRERFESESDVEDIPRRKDPIEGHHASWAMSHLLAPASQIPSTTTASTTILPPKTWRSLSKQRELRPVIREQQQQQPLSGSRSIPDNIIAAPPYDESYTTTSTSTSKSTALTTAAEKEAEDPFNLLLEEYVNDEDVWWQPHPSLFFVGL
ncbi:uncharacterized protein K489DRAFT_73089 [Dissoconium aciculare CBS 342.82]|uniref:Uncharacterized protein n=1 Tax=Dissoconium aciculare CBS 342.82 TaxID=1314786 RepID=A0A6J3LTV4_9PEZI|nr:uncharacterized protein K489DRAFT_73089 [Dissoconium aciculare CBS 342.82]KAF1819063.1 hypothetical protein K489DRAFT_73089 [Dissoconium aciculare CBS 342.82]